MGNDTGIEWTDATWNPVRGCSRVSPGCENCYAEAVAARFSGPGLAYEGLARRSKGGEPRWTGEVRMVPEHLADPLRWKRPRRIFVNSMSDLFHERLSDADILSVWLVMARARQHTFQILTKRAERMKDFLSKWVDNDADGEPLMARGPVETRRAHPGGRGQMFAALLDGMGDPPPGAAFPTFDWMEGPRWLPNVLPNVWLGVSAENQEQLDKRWPYLRDTPAAVRFLSIEPQLEDVSLDAIFGLKPGNSWAECLCAEIDPSDRPCLTCDGRKSLGAKSGLHWVICGGESGRGARPFDLAWGRSLIAQCKAAGVPVFFKQAGASPVDSALRDVWANGEHHYTRPPDDEVVRQAEAAPGYSVTVHQLGRLLRDRKGGDLSALPEDLRVRQFPEARR